MYDARAMPVLLELLASVGWHDAPLDRLEIVDDGLALATPWPVTANAVAALAAVGLAAAHLQELRSGTRRPVRIETRHAGLAMASSSYLRVNGEAAKFRDPFTGFYEAANGRAVFLHGNFAHLRDGLVRMLGAKDAGDVARVVKGRDAFEVEALAIDAGLCAAAVRTRPEWLAEPQAAAVRALPLVQLTRIGEGPGRGPAPGSEPLGGVRMLDFSRVIAGPMAGRTMAEFGAEVLLVCGPALPSIQSLVIDTGFGKRSAEIDLRTDAGRRELDGLIAEADVFLDAYRPGALSAKGYSGEALARTRPGIVHVSLDAFSAAGPWNGRRGYDSLVQATTGMCFDGRSVPANLPCQPLDYLTGYLAAFGAMVALIRQLSEGGSWSVQLSLARTSEWMWTTLDALGPEADVPARNPTIEEAAGLIAEYPSAFGTIAALRPPLQDPDWRWQRGPAPLGSDEARWI